MRIMAVACAVASAATMVGCSAFRPATQIVTIRTSVSDADIYVNGNPVGKSPVSSEVRRDRDVSVIARKQGYEPAARTVGNHFNGTGALDAVGAVLCLFPAIGLCTPGAWSLDEADIMIPMFPIVDPYTQHGDAAAPPAAQESPDTNAPTQK